MAEPYCGEIRIFAGRYAPEGWSFCNGAVLPIKDYEKLFSLIGTTYGGDGSSNFALPDLQGRVAMSLGPSPVPPNTLYKLGQHGGAETITLTPANLPEHTHQAYAVSELATAPAAEADSKTMMLAEIDAGSVTQTFYLPASNAPSAMSPLSPAAITNSGVGAPSPNLMPSIALSYIIALNGLYPTPAPA
jgi:microcystin-dependent protein